MVCKLLKFLYGLMQAPKQWHEQFDRTLTSAGFIVNEADNCVYYRYGRAEGVILFLYVDDILIFGTSLNVIKEVKDFLSQTFAMKEKVLSRFGYSDYKPVSTPYDASLIRHHTMPV